MDGNFNCLSYADDIVLLNELSRELKEIYQKMDNYPQKVELKVNQDEMEFMQLGRRQEQQECLEVDAMKLKRVQHFKYLGSWFTSDYSKEKDMKERIPVRMKYKNIRIYNTVIRLAVKYSSETWSMTKQQKEKLLIFEKRVTRKIWGPILDKGEWRRKNEEIYILIQQPTILQKPKSKRIKRWVM
ncbi:uncharacterized protein LOC126244428 [Schistocerca nitens]|uniref:uncharacterized protein LOC126244428 n=1 Tax=Schistocerca nitens TaxID=7011 RepID=UPI002118DB11|nr:uncharacterized protein LOC126244428 [Schistocerca nitens]